MPADKSCKERYHIPYVVRRRRWERVLSMRDDRDDRDTTSGSKTAAGDDELSQLSRDSRSVGSRSRSRSRSRSGSDSRHASRSRSHPRPRSCSARSEVAAGGASRGVPDPVPIPVPGPTQVPVPGPTPAPPGPTVNDRRARRHYHRQATPRISEAPSLGRTPPREKETLHHRRFTRKKPPCSNTSVAPKPNPASSCHKRPKYRPPRLPDTSGYPAPREDAVPPRWRLTRLP
ncbi:hypothetical protein HPB50_007219 [Hyalomma asiaticum]|uniref:Uncharacterized protein n=1 Tax=Hyalomma asiaticum TaxID=266040 RepID=A0ACB7S5E6_HYAAI|nr:hypothetical protein HPB50_007219 [Hyalomma asiaticum]